MGDREIKLIWRGREEEQRAMGGGGYEMIKNPIKGG